MVEDALKFWRAVYRPFRRDVAPLLPGDGLFETQLLLSGTYVRFIYLQSTVRGLERLFGDVLVLLEQSLQARVLLTGNVCFDA